MSTYPNKLRAFRTKGGQSIEEVAAFVGLKGTLALVRWENGDTRPNAMQFLKLCALYDAAPWDVYPDLYKELKRELKAREKELKLKKAKPKKE